MSFILIFTVYAGWDCKKILDLGDTATLTYDLSRFQQNPQDTGARRWRHIAKNSDTNALGSYDWYFDVCADTKEVPLSAPNEHPHCCDQVWQSSGSTVPRPPGIVDEQAGFLDQQYNQGSTPIFMTGPGPAWQVETQMNGTEEVCTRCYRLGRSYTENNGVKNLRGIMNWGVMSDVNPTEGVYIEYLEGDTEIPGCNGNNRQFRIVFECNPSAPSNEHDNLDTSSAVVNEDPLCTYTVKFKSTAGCPVECPHRTRDGIEKLCDGHGHCELDAGLQKPRCFCDVGWTGADCGTSSNDEIAMATDRCYPLSGGGYVKGSCNGDSTMYSASKYRDAQCTNRQSGPDNFITASCTSIYGLDASISCLVSSGPAVLDTEACSATNESSSSSSSSSNGLLLTLLIFLSIGLLFAVGFLVYKQMKQPDLNNFLVLNDDTHTTQL